MTTPSPVRWERIDALFGSLVALPPEQRDAWLDAHAAEDEALRREVRSLLEAHEHGAESLDALAAGALTRWVSELAEDEEPGDLVGPYRIRREVGRGASSVVYEAAREGEAGAPVVALKLLRGEWDATRVAARFRRERHLLARLAHPSIAALRDAGVAADGRPYVVLDFVDGAPIDRHCAARRLDVRARVALLLDVCAAVAHAHRLLVVHRDLKPANILVTADGTPTLLDFGIARVLAPTADDASDPLPPTRPGEQPYTPEYASPELLRGEPATTAADVYALGVLLYELLTGVRPHAVGALPAAEAAAAIAATAPARPSDAIAARLGAPGLPGEPERVAVAVRGDLDAVVLTALRADGALRYATVDAFADDLRRWLESRSVQARPGAVADRLRRWTRRHRVAAAAIAAGVPVALLGMAGTVWQMREAQRARREAEQRYAQVRDLAGGLLYDVHDLIADFPGTTALRAQLAERALRQLTRLSADAPDDPTLLRDLAFAFQRVGDARGGVVTGNLGDRAAARDAYARGLAVAERAARLRPDDAGLTGLVALLLERSSDLQASGGDPRGALAVLRRALDTRRRLALAAPAAPRPALEHVVTLVKLGDLSGHPAFVNAGDRAGAQSAYEEAVARLDAPPLAGDTAFQVRRYRGLVQERLGRMFQIEGDRVAARAALERALERRAALAAERPQSVEARRDVAIAHYLLADLLLQSGDAGAAERHARASLATRDSLAAADRNNMQLVRGLALARGQLARVAAAAGRAADARAELARAQAQWGAFLRGATPSRADQAELDSLRALGGRVPR